MPADHLNMDELNEARRQAVAKTIHPVSTEELKTLGEGLFPYMDHPWREAFFTFINQNPGAAFYHAVTDDQVHFIYCHTHAKGMWFMPGSGMGPMKEKGLKALKAIVE